MNEIFVIDASVALKWFFRSDPQEDDTERAVSLLRQFGAGKYRMIQPPHFLAEMAAVLARKKPDEAQADLADLQALDWELCENPVIYRIAIDMSTRLEHHLFDTLYHAVALSLPNASLVTADQTYFEKAQSHGCIESLGNE